MSGINWDDEAKIDQQSVEQELNRVRKEGNHRKSKRHALAAGTSSLVIAGLLGVLLFPSTTPNTNNQLATPTTVAVENTEIPLSLVSKATQSASAALNNISSLKVKERIESHDVKFAGGLISQTATNQHDFILAADGSFRDTWTTKYSNGNIDTTNASYLASTGIETFCTDSNSNEMRLCTKRFSAALQPESIGGMAALVDQAAKATNAKATESVDGDSRIWTVSFDQQEMNGTVQSIVTIDQQTGLPISSERRYNGELMSKTQLTDLVVNPNIDAKAIQYAINPDSRTNFTDETLAKNNITGRTFGSTVSTRFASRLATARPEGYTTKEVFTESSGSISPSDVCGQYPMATTISRDGIFMVISNTLDKSVCKEMKADPTFVAEGSELKELAKVTPTEGSLKGATFTVYRLLTGNLFITGETNTNVVYVNGNLRLDDVGNFLNSFSTN